MVRWIAQQAKARFVLVPRSTAPNIGRPRHPQDRPAFFLHENLSIGMYCPPFGLNLFASQAVFKTQLGTIYRGVLPFVTINLLTLLVITYVPAISIALLGRGR